MGCDIDLPVVDFVNSIVKLLFQISVIFEIFLFESHEHLYDAFSGSVVRIYYIFEIVFGNVIHEFDEVGVEQVKVTSGVLIPIQ